jgi:hypothetical protein
MRIASSGKNMSVAGDSDLGIGDHATAHWQSTHQMTCTNITGVCQLYAFMPTVKSYPWTMMLVTSATSRTHSAQGVGNVV